jgi:hypothetical protein
LEVDYADETTESPMLTRIRFYIDEG